MIHATDLFRPHNDPDDHWDLATVFALDSMGLADVRVVLCDFPIPRRRNDPDALAVAQLNYLTGLDVPLVVGPPPSESGLETVTSRSAELSGGIRAVLDVLRDAPRPVVINITGCCRNMALAATLDPELFARKCAAVYLNAGTGSPDPDRASRLEYNVQLDPKAYAAIFKLPCPVYWMPCFEAIRKEPGIAMWSVKEFGTFYRFRQRDILPQLSPRLQNFFTFLYQGGRRSGQQTVDRDGWLRKLLGPVEASELQRQGELFRNMWCTGGFLHAVGKTVTVDGQIVSLGAEGMRPVFTFESIDVQCDASGKTTWRFANKPGNRYIFHVRDVGRYEPAMTAALKMLLMQLP